MAFQPLEAVRQRFDFRVQCPPNCRVAPLAQFDRRSPLVKLGQQSGLDLLKLFCDPLLVFVG